MADHSASTATGFPAALGDGGQKESIQWDNLEKHFLERAASSGEDEEVKFDSQADFLDFWTKHASVCSPITILHCLESQSRLPTEAWCWKDFKEFAVHCIALTADAKPNTQPMAAHELYEEIWARWQRNEFPLLKANECKNKNQEGFALAITACLEDGDKQQIQTFIAQKHQLQHQSQEQCYDHATIANPDFGTWLQQEYYDGICEFLIDKFIASATLPHGFVDGRFNPFVTATSFQTNTVEKITQERFGKVIEHGLEKWKRSF